MSRLRLKRRSLALVIYFLQQGQGVNTQMSESRGDILIENTTQGMAHHTQV